jgi:CRP-like cAMP-binding protein
MQAFPQIIAEPGHRPAAVAASRDRVLDWLRHCELFSHAGLPALTRVAEQCTARTLTPGTAVFAAGTPSDGFYLVIFGSVSLTLPGPGGAEKLVELVGPRECFGQAAMFLELPFPVAAHATSETLLLHVPRGVVFELLDQDPSLARKMLAGMALRMRRLIHDIEGFAFRSASSRIADYLLTLSAGAATVRLPVAKGALASKLLVAPETLSRVFKEWMRAGIITVKGRAIALLDPAALRVAARRDRS